MTTTKRNKKSRPDQEGSIFFSEARNRWVAQFTAGYDPKTGRRIYRCKMAATRREAAKKLEELKKTFGSARSIDAEHMTTEDWLMEWFHTYSEPKVRENTQVSYLTVLGIIIRHVGHIPLIKLTAHDLQHMLFTDLRERYRTAQMARMLMKKSFGKAVKNKLISENPASDLELPPKPPKREFVKPSQEDWQKLIEAKSPYRGWRLIMLTEYVTGARISEILALKWEDISVLTGKGKDENWQRLDGGAITGQLTGGALHIGHSLITGRAKEKGGHHPVIRSATKTRDGDRHLPLPADYCKELLSYRHDERQYRIKMGEAYKDEGYVFSLWDGSPISPSTICAYFTNLRRRLGIGTTMHMLRHDMASRMKASHKFDLKDVQAQLGHSTIQITMDLYTHIDDIQKEQVKDWLQDGMADLLSQKRSKAESSKEETV